MVAFGVCVEASLLSSSKSDPDPNPTSCSSPISSRVSVPSSTRSRILHTTRNIKFQDTAPPLKVKDSRSILAFYSFRLDTNIKLAVS